VRAGGTVSRHSEASRRAASAYRKALRAVALGEGRAYGFTLVIWTVGAIVGHLRGQPGVGEAVAYLAGAFAGVGLTLALAFGGVGAVRAGTEQIRMSLGLLHLVSVAAGVVVGWAIGAAAPRTSAFFLAPMGAVLVYQLAIAAEVALTSREDTSEEGEEGDPVRWRET
jgi:hypothetical protein